MNVLIQHPQTLQFLDASRQWTSDEQKALVFRTSSEALDCAVAHVCGPYQIVLKFDDAMYDVTLGPEFSPKPIRPPSGTDDDAK